jgi:hypothetical protein
LRHTPARGKLRPPQVQRLVRVAPGQRVMTCVSLPSAAGVPRVPEVRADIRAGKRALLNLPVHMGPSRFLQRQGIPLLRCAALLRRAVA